VCNTESIFLCVSTSEAEPPPPATHYHFNHWRKEMMDLLLRLWEGREREERGAGELAPPQI